MRHSCFSRTLVGLKPLTRSDILAMLGFSRTLVGLKLSSTGRPLSDSHPVSAEPLWD